MDVIDCASRLVAHLKCNDTIYSFIKRDRRSTWSKPSEVTKLETFKAHEERSRIMESWRWLKGDMND